MLAIRLTRMGAKKQPSYRIIVTRKRYKRDGRYIAKLGFYNPMTDPATVVVDRAQFDDWVLKGAQPSDVVKRIVLGISGTKHRAPKKSVEPKPEKVAVEDSPVLDETSETPEVAETPEITDESETEAENKTDEAAPEVQVKDEDPATAENPEPEV